MKICVRGGHNPQAQGANSPMLNEVIEDRKIYKSVIKYLVMDKQAVVDGTPYPCVTSEDLRRGVKDAEDHDADLFVSIHLNAFNNNAHGTCALHYKTSKIGKAYATKISSALAKFGFYNRGAVADSRGLYELNQTTMPSVIVECFFLDSKTDADLYKKVGSDAIGKSIAEAIVGHSIKPPIVINAKVTIKYVLEIQKTLNRLGIRDSEGKTLVEDNISGKRTKDALNKLVAKI